MSEVNLYIKSLIDVTDGGDPVEQVLMRLVEGLRPATADEIRAAHPKCGTCRYAELLKHATAPRDYYICGINDDLAIDLDEDYCRHHTPKEGAQR